MDAMVRGQDQVVAQKAQAIHDSFIMKRKMTNADRKVLKESVPAAFIQRDQAFHALSAELAQAARDGDRPRQRKIFSEMLEAWVKCHALHATNRFPSLAPNKTQQHK